MLIFSIPMPNELPMAEKTWRKSIVENNERKSEKFRTTFVMQSIDPYVLSISLTGGGGGDCMSHSVTLYTHTHTLYCSNRFKIENNHFDND